jgi:hypothetical protein
MSNSFTRFVQVVIAAFILSLAFPAQPAHAAPFRLRAVTQPLAEYSTLGTISVSFEIYDEATNLRVTTSGTNVTLALIRCPGFPSACTPTVINASYASGTTSSGLVSFSLNPPTANTDYYFRATATGVNTGTSTDFDVVGAYAVYQGADGTMPSTLTTLSRFPRQVAVRRGSTSGPVDTTVNGKPAYLDLLQCNLPGCSSPTVSVDRLFSTTFINGVATFDILFSSTYTGVYLVTDVPSSLSSQGSTTFEVLNAYLVAEPTFTAPNSTASRFDMTVAVRRGPTTSDPIDTLANNITLALDLRKCTNFLFSACIAFTTITSNFNAAFVVNGVANFTAMTVPNPDTSLYLAASKFSPAGGFAFSGVSPGFFQVRQAYLELSPEPSDRFVGETFTQTVNIRISGPNTIDTMADSVPLRLQLWRCSPPVTCVSTINDNPSFATITVNDGTGTFTGLVVNTANQHHFLRAFSHVGENITDDSTNRFDVYAANSVRADITYQGRPAPPSTLLAVPITVIFKPTSGGTFQTRTVTANNNGQATMTNVLPGTYTVWVKHANALARQVTSAAINAPGSTVLVFGIFRGGDANNDNVITVSDFAVMAASFGLAENHPSFNPNADFNGDGLVNINDFSILASNFGAAGPAQPTP